VLTRLAPRSTPLWPDASIVELAMPSAGAVTIGARVLVGCAIALFALLVLERITAGWHRRRWLVALVLILLAAAAGLVAGDPLAATARGAAAGVALVAVVMGVLRFDAATLPPFVATGATLAFAEDAVRGAWPAAPMHAIAVAATAGALAWVALRYLDAARAATERLPPSPSTA
jgi:hypothetical protein